MAHIDHDEIVLFADEYVNLKKEDVIEYRAQAKRLRDRLEAYIAEHPDFVLKKMLLSGSLAKGTALKDIDDIDVAVYISSKDAPETIGEMIDWLAKKLQNAFPNMKPEQVVANPSTITVSFIGTGLRVDVVPILYDGDKDWKGHMVSKHTGEKVLTSIPLHLEFIRKRKEAHDVHYAQIIRLLKFWVKQRKLENPDFRFKSFMIELLVAHLVSQGLKLDNYPQALAKIFAYIAADGMKSPIVFSDNYHPGLCVNCPDTIHVWDPVNHENNVAKKYTEAQRQAIVEAALDAGDAIDSALRAHTKAEALRYWRKVFGNTFS